MRKTIQSCYMVIKLFFLPMVLLITVGNLMAKSTVTLKYIPQKETVEEIILENETYQYTIKIDNAVRLQSIIEKSSGYNYLQRSRTYDSKRT